MLYIHEILVRRITADGPQRAWKIISTLSYAQRSFDHHFNHQHSSFAACIRTPVAPVHVSIHHPPVSGTAPPSSSLPQEGDRVTIDRRLSTKNMTCRDESELCSFGRSCAESGHLRRRRQDETRWFAAVVVIVRRCLEHGWRECRADTRETMDGTRSQLRCINAASLQEETASAWIGGRIGENG